MRRILFPLLMIGVTVGMFSIGSGAFFSAEQASTGNTITAGTFNLTCTAQKGSDAAATCGSANYVVSNAYPGQALPDFTMNLTNSSSTLADLYVKFTFTPGGDLVAGDINATREATVSGGTASSVLGSTTISTLAGLPTSCTKVIDSWPGSGTASLRLKDLAIDFATPNNRQGDTLTISATWSSVQAGATAPSC